MPEHIIIHGQGAQALYHTPVDRLGRPTRVASATYVIADLRQPLTSSERIVAEGSVTVDAVSTTLTADAGPSTAYPNRLSLTSTTGIVDGRSYLLSKADGQRETVTISRVTTGQAHGLFAIQGDYTSGDLLQGIQLSCTFPSSEADDEDETVKDDGHGFQYQVTWTYTIDGNPNNWGELVRVSRYSHQAWTSVDEIAKGYPAIVERTGGRGNVQMAINVATEDVVAELESMGKDPTTVRLGSTGKVLVRHLAMHYLLMWCHGDDDLELSRRFWDRYQAILQNLRVGRSPRDVVELDGAADTPTKKDPGGSIFIRP